MKPKREPHFESRADSPSPAKPNPPETISRAWPGESWRLRVNFGVALAALQGRKAASAPAKIVEIVLRVNERATAGGTRDNPIGVVLHGFASWRASGCESAFKVPSELRCPFVPTRGFPVQLSIGEAEDGGGLADGSWIVGQFGTVISAEQVGES